MTCPGAPCLNSLSALSLVWLTLCGIWMQIPPSVAWGLLSAAVSFTLSAGLQLSHIVLVMCTIWEAILSFSTAPMDGWVPSVVLTRLWVPATCEQWAMYYPAVSEFQSTAMVCKLLWAARVALVEGLVTCLPGLLWGWRAGGERVRGILTVFFLFRSRFRQRAVIWTLLTSVI